MPTRAPAEATEEFIDAQGARVRVWRAGDGPPLVVIVDCGDPLELWTEAFEGFAQEHEVVIVEQPGFGYSDAGPGFDYRWNAHLGALRATVEHLDVSDALAVGHCVAGTQLQAISTVEPGRFRAAVLAETFPADRYRAMGTGLAMHKVARLPGIGRAMLAAGGRRGLRRGARYLLRTLADDPSWVDDEILDRYTAPLRKGHNRVGGLLHIRRFDGEAGAPAECAAMPAAYLLGAGGHFRRFQRERTAFAEDHGRHVELLDAAGHFLFAERPAAFVRRCTAMLDALTGEESSE